MTSTKKNILLVEDEALIALQGVQTLEQAGYAAAYVLSGEEAVQAVGERPGDIDLVLMDIDLGEGMDGIEAAKEILSRHDLPVLFVSSHMEPAIVEKAETITSYGYVVKSSPFIVIDASIKMALKLFESRRKEHEKEITLLKKQEKLNFTVEATQAGLWDWDMVTGLMEINERWAEMVGYAKAELEPLDIDGFNRMVHPEDLVRSGKITEDYLSGAIEKHVVELRLRHKDGHWVWVIDRGAVTERSGDGEPLHMAGLHFDISRQKRSEEEYRKTQAILKSTMDSTKDIYIISVDKDFNCLYRNQSYHDYKLRTIGVDIEIGSNLAATLDKDVFLQASRASFEAAFDGRSTRVIEENKEFGLCIEAVYNPILSEAGEVIGATAFSIDILGRKAKDEELSRSQGRYKALLDSIGEGYSFMDEKGICRMANRQTRLLFGLEGEDPVGRPGLDYVDEASRGMMLAEWEKRKAGVSSTYTWPMRARDGTERVLRVSASPVFDGEGNFIGSSNIYTDITLEARNEQALGQLSKRQEILIREFGHRVKNSLLIVASLLGIAKKDVRDPSALGVLSDTEARISSILSVYRRLDLAGTPGSLDFGPYLRDLSESILRSLSRDPLGISLKIDVCSLMMDTKRAITLGLIANELLTNSLKHAFPGGGAGSISVSLASRGGRVSLTVADDGAGLPADIDPGRSASMGMMLLRELTRELGGSVAVDRAKGTSITVSFKA
jgi:PAS domain S-box-containing protein